MKASFKLLVNSLKNSEVGGLYPSRGSFAGPSFVSLKSLNCFQGFNTPQVLFRNCGMDFRQTSYSRVLEFPMHK